MNEDTTLPTTTPIAEETTTTPVVAVPDAIQEIPAEGEQQVEAAPAEELPVAVEETPAAI
jgi:hypothetical protein